MFDQSDSQNKSEEQVNLSEGTSPSSSYDEGSRSTPSNLPKAATRQRRKRNSESEDEDSDSSLGDPEELSHDLALLVKKFQKLSRRGRFGRPSRSNDSSSSDYKKRIGHKCKKPGHYIQDCP